MKKLPFLLPLLALCFFQSAKLKAQNFNLTQVAHLSYGSTTLANICGYAAGGKEYALVGAATGMSIVDVTTPSSPVVITQIPNINNLWKEIKVYQHWAYVTTEGGGGLQIVDLTNLPGTNLTYHNYTGDGAINGQLNTIHALHIDTTKKFVYLYGSNLFSGAAIVLDINSDPYNPTYAGKYQNAQWPYVHDGYVDNDTLYASHIYDGYFTVADMTNKNAPVVLGAQQTPTSFTHNTWLSNDHKTVFTTDENNFSYMTAYDISNLNNITETDRIQTTPGSGSVVHNTHIKDNWAIVSWYRDGIAIIDVTRPNNLVVVGRYDTYTAGCCQGMDGAWGVYPYLPSGTLVVSNIDEGLYVLSPTYVRACYLEGNVTDSACGTSLNNVTITISSVNVTDSTDISGSYAMGTAVPGTYNVTFSKPGYTSVTITGVSFSAGVVTNLNVQMSSAGAVNMNGSVTDASNSAGLPAVNVTLSGANFYNFTTDASGNFSSCSIVGGTYTVTTAAWGYETVCNTQTLNTGNPNVNIALNKEYYDDFSQNLGWTVSSTASTGIWVRGVPIGTTNGAAQSNPGADVTTDCTNRCYVTGNAGGTASQDDVDGGATTLTSPVFDLSTYGDAWIHYDRWFYNAGGSGTPNDSLKVFITNGSQTVLMETVLYNTPNNSSWVHSAKQVSQYLTPTATMQLIVRTADAGSGHIVEAGFDKFMVADSLLTTSVNTEIKNGKSSISAFPNPFSQQLQINWSLGKNPTAQTTICIFDLTGRIVKTIAVNTIQGTAIVNEELQNGVYMVRLMDNNEVRGTVKVVKVQ